MPPPCAACKSARRKCKESCIFAPYFPQNEPDKFSCVRQVFGLKNIKKMLEDTVPEMREAVVNTLVYEANIWITNPVYGSVGYISLIKQHVDKIRMALDNVSKLLADPPHFSAPAPAPSQFHHPQFQGSAPFAEQQMMGLGLATSAATPQPMIWNHSQSQMVEVAASDAAQEQQMFGSFHQHQPQEFLRLDSNIFTEQQMMGLDVTTGAATQPSMIWNQSQPMILDQSQSQMFQEACGIYNNVEVPASDAAQEQQMFDSFHQHQPFTEQQMMGLDVTTGAATPQPMIWDQSQSQMLQEACGIYNNVEVAVSDAAQEQQMFGSFDQHQQQEFLWLGSDPFTDQQMMGLDLTTGAAQSQMLVEAQPMVDVVASDEAQEQQQQQ